MKMKLIISMFVSLFASKSFASILYKFDVKIVVLPISNDEMDRRVMLALKYQRKEGIIKPQDIEQKRLEIRKQSKRDIEGFSQKALESFAIQDGSTYAKLAYPSSGFGANAINVTEVFANKTTWIKGHSSASVRDDSKILNGDARTRFKFAAERIVYANVDFRNYEVLSERTEKDGTHYVRIRDNYDPKTKPTHHIVDLWFNNDSCSKLLRADHYQSSYAGPPYLMKKFYITSHKLHLGKYLNANINVEYFQKNVKFSIWKYQLSGLGEFDFQKPESIFAVGEEIIDARLGADKAVNYEWRESIPTMKELENLRNQIDRPIFGIAKPMTAIWIGIGLVLTAIGFAVLRHKSVITKRQ